MDQNINADVLWYVENNLEQTTQLLPSYNQSSLSSDVRQVTLKDEFESSFAFSASLLKLKVIFFLINFVKDLLLFFSTPP